MREVCREVAHSLGFSAVVAESAEQVYRMIETQNIDAVLLDLRLPGADGLEVLPGRSSAIGRTRWWWC